MILFLKPVFFHRVWGGEKLRTEFNYDTMESCGEAWGISAHQNGSSIIENGMYKGKTLRELFNEQRELFGNYSADEFPIIVKFIHAKEDLSVHTHPDNDYAKKHHNSLGKDKCWYVLDAQPGAKVIIGHFAADKKELITFLFLTVILAPFAAGLVIYWSFNNIFTMIQQYIVQRKMTIKTT